MARALIVNRFATNVTDVRLAAVLEALGDGVAVYETTGKGHAQELARELDGTVSALYVFSGDGTYNEAVNGSTGLTPLGFIPGGGTSVLPRALGLPRDPLATARRLASSTRTRRISLPRANGRRFAFSAGFGLDAELVRRVDARGRSASGQRPGDLAFVAEGLAVLRATRFRLPARLELEGVGEAAFALVANGAPYTYAGRFGLRLAPAASFEGGVDVVAPPALGRLGVVRAAWWAAGRGSAHVRLHDADGCVLRAFEPLALQLDGEDLGDATDVVIEVERAAIDVIV